MSVAKSWIVLGNPTHSLCCRCIVVTTVVVVIITLHKCNWKKAYGTCMPIENSFFNASCRSMIIVVDIFVAPEGNGLGNEWHFSEVVRRGRRREEMGRYKRVVVVSLSIEESRRCLYRVRVGVELVLAQASHEGSVCIYAWGVSMTRSQDVWCYMEQPRRKSY
ncbi:unnamed protein product [Sphenostylis stenocarpa]|uniref:Uncharacterized protein n=1 Tax=Sphenostylis stenocarpa TaxID=92480 RepID=A0AA86S9V3_9FABA|nr:unnamed protein product [Sphenostylis stenocarpa]